MRRNGDRVKRSRIASTRCVLRDAAVGRSSESVSLLAFWRLDGVEVGGGM
jgi:hypothetical protein